MMNYLHNITKLIESTGGEVIDNRYVVKPGVMMIAKTKNHIPYDILDLFNIGDTDSLVELNSRITYMNFNKRDNLVDKVVNELKHHSVLQSTYVTFLVAGIKGETLLEFTSSGATISRQTTSRTKSADDTLYCVNKDDIEHIDNFISLRDGYKDKCNTGNLEGRDKVEKLNEFNLFTKAMSFTITMNLSDWIYYCNKKIEQDYEIELKNICIMIRDILMKEYAWIKFS